MRHLRDTRCRGDSDDVARCLDDDVSSSGSTGQEALANLMEALELYPGDFPDSSN